MYDVTDEDSFAKAKSWYKELRHEIGEAPIILAGNKCDILNQTVQKEVAEQFAREKQIEHVSTSAANGNNVDYIFTALAESKSLTTHFVQVADTGSTVCRNDGCESTEGVVIEIGRSRCWRRKNDKKGSVARGRCARLQPACATVTSQREGAKGKEGRMLW